MIEAEEMAAQVEAQLEAARKDMQASLEKARAIQRMVDSDGYKLAKKIIQQRLFASVPKLNVGQDAPLQAFAYYEMCRGVQYFFETVESIVLKKQQIEQALEEQQKAEEFDD